MPKTVIKEIICPQCNAVTEGKLYTSINATNNPHLRNEVLEEKIFDWTCHACGHKARLTYPLLYNDMKRRFTFKDLSALVIDDFTLLVHDIIIFQDVLTNIKVACFDTFLCFLNGI